MFRLFRIVPLRVIVAACFSAPLPLLNVENSASQGLTLQDLSAVTTVRGQSTASSSAIVLSCRVAHTGLHFGSSQTKRQEAQSCRRP